MNFKKSIVAAALITVLSACGEKTTEEHITEAQNLIKNNELPAAIIELKNATRLEPNNSEVRLLLGDIYFETGQIRFAEKEYLKAIEFGANEQKVFPKLAEVLFYLTDYQQVTELEYFDSPEDSEGLDKVYFLQALSARNLQDSPAANHYFNQVLELEPNTVYGKFAQVLSAAEKDSEGTLMELQKLMVEYPNFALGHLVTGQLESQLNRPKQALESFNKFNQLTPELLLADLYYSVALVQNNKFDEAIDVASKVVKQHKGQPLANQILATSYFNLKNYEQAYVHAELAINNNFDSLQSRIVAGLSAYSLEKYELAYSHFSKIKSKLPSDHFARQAILSTEIRIGKIEELASSVANLSDTLLQPEIINAASLELFKAGKAEDGKRLLGKASDIEYTDSDNLSKLGVLKISTSDFSGIEDLEKAVELDPQSVPLRITLGSAYIQAKQINKAELFAKDFIEAFPNNIESYNFAALVAYYQNNQKEVKQYLESALVIDPLNKMSLLYKANLAYQDDQYNEAFDLAKKVLSKEPGYIPAIQTAVAASLKTNKQSELQAIFNAGMNSINKEEVELIKATLEFSNQEYSKVLETLSNSSIDTTTPDLFWTLIIRSAYYSEGIKASENHLEKWITAQPNNPRAWKTYITFLERHQRSAKAYEISSRAHDKFSQSDEFSLTYAYYLSLDDKEESAKAILADIDQTDSNKALLKLTQAQLELKPKNYDRALSLVNEAYDITPSFNAARLKYALLKSLNGSNSAFEFAEQHLKNYSFDNSMRLTLANEYIAVAPDSAIRHYKVVVQQLPKNITALNNLAYLLANNEEYASAIEYGLKAIEVDSSNANVLDTVGMVYFKSGHLAKANELLQAAYKIAPTNTTIQRHLKEIESKL